MRTPNAAGLVPGSIAVALFAFAARASPLWLQRHAFQPGYFHPPGPGAAWVVRIAAALLGFALLVLALRARSWSTIAFAGLAVGFSLLTVEAALQAIDMVQEGRRKSKLEARLGQPDPRLGWTLTPSRTTKEQVFGSERQVRYAIDAHGDRAPSQDFVEDPRVPTVLLAGESIAFGHALDWDEALPGRLQRALRVQVVDVAVGGYGNDQAFLRLRDALPRFQRVVATVTVLVPVQLGRNVQRYRPRLVLRDSALVPADGEPCVVRLCTLLTDGLPLLGEARLEETLRLTRAILEETARISPALFVLLDMGEPHGATDWLEQELLRGLRHVRVELRRDQLTADQHPDAKATLQIARAIADELRRGKQ